MEGQLRAWVRARGLDRVIGVHGGYAAADLPGILARADVVAMPCLWEGLPLVLVEAMQQGVPFAAMDAGGIADLVNPDVEVVPVEIEPAEGGPFVAALGRLAARLRAGAVDARRLHAWAEGRYGYEAVAAQWRRALLEPEAFFAPAGAVPAA
jgi:glycosyltransferase involved in cell wall biosynthesis